MKKKLYKLVLYTLDALLLLTRAIMPKKTGAKNYSPEFDSAMGNGSRSYIIKKLYQDACRQQPILAGQEGWDLATKPRTHHAFLTFLQQLYEKNRLDKIKPDTESKVPRIIHQIWLGSPLPEHYNQWQKSWQFALPGWDYKLWTDADAATMKLDNQLLYDGSTNYGQKADILRYEILYRFGGVYVDMDFACIDPALFDLLGRCYDLYIGVQPAELKIIALGIGLIGARPQHPVLRAMIESLQRQNFSAHDPVYIKTGPVPFTRIFWDHADKSGLRDIALPGSFFYPIGTCHRFYPARITDALIGPETGAVHYWAGSWKS